MWSGILISVWFQIALSHSTNDVLQMCRTDPPAWNNVSPLQLAEGIETANICSTTSYGTVWRKICSCTCSRFKHWYCTDTVASAGWEFRFRDASATKRWAVSETNVSPEVAVGALFTNDRTISLPYRLCPMSIWKHLSSSHMLWQKKHTSGVMFLTHFINTCSTSMFWRAILLYLHAVELL